MGAMKAPPAATRTPFESRLESDRERTNDDIGRKERYERLVLKQADASIELLLEATSEGLIENAVNNNLREHEAREIIKKELRRNLIRRKWGPYIHEGGLDADLAKHYLKKAAHLVTKAKPHATARPLPSSSLLAPVDLENLKKSYTSSIIDQDGGSFSVQDANKVIGGLRALSGATGALTTKQQLGVPKRLSRRGVKAVLTKAKAGYPKATLRWKRMRSQPRIPPR